MAAKRGSLLSPKVRLFLEKALLEALRRHIESRAGDHKKKAPARKKKVTRKTPARKKTAGRRKRRA